MKVDKFYDKLKDYIGFVMRKRMSEKFGSPFAYDLIFPKQFEFTFDTEIIYLNGLPIKTTKYDNYVFTFDLKKTLSTLPDKKSVKVYIDANFFDIYVLNDKEDMPHLNSKTIYIHF